MTQALELFAKLEAENLALIQECQEAEARLGEGKEISVRTRTELNQQAANLEAEIRQLEVINFLSVSEVSMVLKIFLFYQGQDQQ